MDIKRPSDSGSSKRYGWEVALFLVAAVVGIYALGQGLNGLFFAGQAISLAWLAVAGVALFILCAQMGRVHDTWPHRPPDAHSTGTDDRSEPAKPPTPTESR